MCKYAMDPVSIVEDTEWTDGQTDKVKPVDPPFNFVEAEGMILSLPCEVHTLVYTNI